MNGTPPTLEALHIRLPAHGYTVLDAVRTRSFTGEVTLIGAPAVRLWADAGRIYLAEQLGDPPLAATLVANGALTSEQLARGLVRIADRDDLGALFDRVPTVDRHAVLLAVAASTASALRTIARQLLAGADIVPYAFDPHGIHAWGASPFAAATPPSPAVHLAAPLGTPRATAAADSDRPAEPSDPSPAQVGAAVTPTSPPPPPPAGVVPVGAPLAPPPATRRVAPATAATPAATAVAAPAPSPAVTQPIDWDRLPYLDRLAAEREGRGPDVFSVIWPDGDVERRSSTNGQYANGTSNGTSSLAGVPAGTRTRMLDDRFGAL